MERNLCGDCCHDVETDVSLAAFICSVQEETQQGHLQEILDAVDAAYAEWERVVEEAETPEYYRNEILRRMGVKP